MGRSPATAFIVSLEGSRCKVAEAAVERGDAEDSAEEEAAVGTRVLRNLLLAKCARLMMSIISSKKTGSRINGFGMYCLEGVINVTRMVLKFEAHTRHIEYSQ